MIDTRGAQAHVNMSAAGILGWIRCIRRGRHEREVFKHFNVGSVADVEISPTLVSGPCFSESLAHVAQCFLPGHSDSATEYLLIESKRSVPIASTHCRVVE